MSCKIASYVYAIAVLKSSDANWFVGFDEIEKRFSGMLEKPLKEDKELVEKIQEELFNYNGLADGDAVWVDDDCFDINLFHDYRATYTDLDEEEDWEEE